MDPYIISQGIQLEPYFLAISPKVPRPANAATTIMSISFISFQLFFVRACFYRSQHIRSVKQQSNCLPLIKHSKNNEKFYNPDNKQRTSTP